MTRIISVNLWVLPSPPIVDVVFCDWNNKWEYVTLPSRQTVDVVFVGFSLVNLDIVFFYFFLSE